ncbi:MAG: FAD-dependent oxidoreductase [Sporocytophaga sp.]|uniref:glycerol-3-phosphate dehydrogenase/oxidase n=1 Tax=Sporocytophaga sp. TaxID=2231183 RepID=UPI001B0C230A|nr:FAD-dependent oxidoreductase [Sporocytophaga sp.]MBO9698776.1 FAD-dependent oxidoreductase [Sporocytophaga sp.]
MISFSNKNRNLFRDRLVNEKFDLLIIGGGVTGAGILLDAQTRGLKAALIEMQDFAQGTSSRSTKLIHGGLRYLKQFEFALVAEVGKERAIVHKNAPHLTIAEKMLLPLTEKGSIGKLGARFGLWLYDFLAGVKKGERRIMLSAEEVLKREPLLDKTKTIGGALYYEYRTDDARLTFEIIKEAVLRDGLALNYLKAEEMLFNGERKIVGVKAKDLITGDICFINADYVINATGPWVDETDALDQSSKKSKIIHTKGVHIVIDHKKLPLGQSVYFDVPDGRMVFAIPREGKTYIGTTDTFYTGDIVDPEISLEDREYLINATNQIFPNSDLKLSDIESGWAGLRPLVREEGKSPSAISRKDEVFEYESGLITIAGGKLTGYRKMAEKVIDIIRKRIKVKIGQDIGYCQTAAIQLAGGKFSESLEKVLANYVKDGERVGLSAKETEKVFYRFGSNTEKVLKYAQEEALEGISLYWSIQLQYCLEEEMIAGAEDFFVRRTGALYFDIDEVRKYKEAVVNHMSNYFQWPENVRSSNLKSIDNLLFNFQGGK